MALLALLLSCGTPPKPAAQPWFTDIAGESGLGFRHISGAEGKYYMPEIIGAGCALLDYDQDGDLDALLIQSGSLEKPAAGHRLFRNESIPSGKLAFTPVTLGGPPGYGMGAATGDFDNDGRIDLLITHFGSNVLYRNEGNGTFRDVTAQSPQVALPGRWSTSAAFFDYDRDGWQDLVILNYIDFSLTGNKKCYAPTGEIDYCTPVAYRAVPAHLFHNEKGRFVEVTNAAGLDRALGPGLGVAALDANEDGWPDLFVANDTAANHLWINQKNGTFIESALAMGVAYGEEGLAKAGMGVAAGDYDNDGDDDLLVLNLMREGASLFENGGKGNYADVSLRTGMHTATYLYTGFGTEWLDYDNDGFLDAFLANGAVTIREEQRGQPYPFLEKNLLLRNPGRGGKFADISDLAGPALALREVSRGAAFGDIDNDGDVDILIANNNGPARLLRNDTPKRNWIAVEIEGPGLGIGAVVRVNGQRRRIHSDSSYASASALAAQFGLGNAEAGPVTIEWPDGSKQEIRDAKTNTRVKVRSRAGNSPPSR